MNKLIALMLMAVGLSVAACAPPAKVSNNEQQFAECTFSPKLTFMFNEDGKKPMDVYMCVKEKQ